MTTFGHSDESLLPDGRPRLRLSPVSPTRLGRYLVIGRLGQGGMGETFLAVDELPHGVRKLVTLKLLHSHLHNDPGSLRAFLEEGRVALSLNHAGLVQSLDVGEFDGRQYIAMEFLHGQTLQAMLLDARSRKSALPRGVSVRVVADALDGLHYMHQASGLDGQPMGLVHRDVCPSNVFVTYHGETKLLDFGISKTGVEPSSTQMALLKGKLGYVAPELASGEPASIQGDIWSMGVVLWEALCGRPLFDGPSEVATLQQIVSMPIEQAYPTEVDVPPSVHRVLMRALDRDPGRRYESAADMRDDLEDWLGAVGRAANRTAVRSYIRESFGDVMDQERAIIREQVGAQVRALSGLTGSWMPPAQATIPPGGYAVVHQGTLPRAAVAAPAPVPENERPRSVPPALPSHVQRDAQSRSMAMEALHDDFEEPQEVMLEDDDEVTTALPLPPEARVRGISVPAAPAVAPAHTTPPPPPPPSASPALGERVAWGVAAAALLLVIGILLLRPEPEPALAVAVPAAPAPAAQPKVTPASAESADQTSAPAPVSEKPSEPRESQKRKAARAARSPSAARSPGASRSQGTTRAEATQEQPPVPEQPPELGKLTLDTAPWSEVSLHGEPLGKTPLVGVELPAGVHELRLVNSELGIDKAYRVTISPDQTVRKRLAID